MGTTKKGSEEVMMDLFDNFMGAMNFYEKAFGFANRLRHRSKGGRLGVTVKIRMKRIDKGGRLPLKAVTDHLQKHGVPTLDHGYDANYRYFRVRKTQLTWAKWLYNDGNLRTPKSAWKDRTR